MENKVFGLKAIGAASLIALGLTGCGPTTESQVAALCVEANAAMESITSDQIVPDPKGDWTEIQSVYSELKGTLQDLSAQASELDDTQLARDFSSVSKAAGSLDAVASLITMVGVNTTTYQEWLDTVPALSHNEALRSPSDRTFIGCK